MPPPVDPEEGHVGSAGNVDEHAPCTPYGWVGDGCFGGFDNASVAFGFAHS